MWATWLNCQEQVVQGRPGHFAQVMRGEYELLGPGVHCRFNRGHFSEFKQVCCMFNGFEKRNPGVDTKQLQMAFIWFPSIREGLNTKGRY